MGRKSARPSVGRPPGRRGKGGTGPGPAYRPSSTGGGTTHNGNCDCPMMAAVQSVKRGKLRLARRYAAMSVRLLVAQVV
jgi:hypothetical protein